MPAAPRPQGERLAMDPNLGTYFLDEQDLANLIEAVERQGQADWQLFLSYATELHLAPDDIVIRQNDRDRSVFVLTSGELKVSIEDGPHGGARDIATVKPVAIFGEQTFLDGRPRSATLTAKNAAVIHRLSLDDFDRLRVEEPELACAFLFDVARSLSLRQRRASR
jgi:SulP family sulfate permease